MKSGKGKFTDAELVSMAEDVEVLEARSRSLAKKIATKKKEILAEMERRGTHAIEHAGRRITYVQATRVVYNEDGLLAKLKPAQVDLITVKRMDTGLLLAAVQSGKIKAALAEKFSEVKENAPYYRLSRGGD